MESVYRTRSWLAAAALALAGTTTVHAATEIAYTQSNPLFPGNSFDAAFRGGSPLPLPSGLEFPWDIDYNAATDRFFAIGAGNDGGTAPPARDFNFNNVGTIWSFDRDGSNAVQHASGLDRPLHLDVTADGQTVFFAEQGEGQGPSFEDNGSIGRLDVTSGNIETVVTAPKNAGPTGVDFDPATGDLFYQANNRGTDISVQQIRRVSGASTASNITAGNDELWLENPTPADGVLDEGGEFTVLSAGRNVAVHDGFVYFTYRNGSFTPNSEIRRLPLGFDLAGGDDPESFETVIGPSEGSVRIIDFEIAGDQLFWTDPQQNGLFSIDLGSNGLPAPGASATLVAQGASNFSSLPIGVAVVPEPASLALLAAGGTLLLARRCRSRA